MDPLYDLSADSMTFYNSLPDDYSQLTAIREKQAIYADTAVQMSTLLSLLRQCQQPHELAHVQILTLSHNPPE